MPVPGGGEILLRFEMPGGGAGFHVKPLYLIGAGFFGVILSRLYHCGGTDFGGIDCRCIFTVQTGCQKR